jgi:hypothetical protein
VEAGAISARRSSSSVMPCWSSRAWTWFGRKRKASLLCPSTVLAKSMRAAPHRSTASWLRPALTYPTAHDCQRMSLFPQTLIQCVYQPCYQTQSSSLERRAKSKRRWGAPGITPGCEATKRPGTDIAGLFKHGLSAIPKLEAANQTLTGDQDSLQTYMMIICVMNRHFDGCL